MSHNPLPVYDVSYPTGEESQGIRNAIELPHLSLFVAQQGVGQIVLCGETSVRFYRVRAYPDDLSFEIPKSLVIISEGTSLLGAAKGTVFRIEEKNYGFLSYEVLEADHLS